MTRELMSMAGYEGLVSCWKDSHWIPFVRKQLPIPQRSILRHYNQSLEIQRWFEYHLRLWQHCTAQPVVMCSTILINNNYWSFSIWFRCSTSIFDIALMDLFSRCGFVDFVVCQCMLACLGSIASMFNVYLLQERFFGGMFYSSPKRVTTKYWCCGRNLLGDVISN